MKILFTVVTAKQLPIAVCVPNAFFNASAFHLYIVSEVVPGLRCSGLLKMKTHNLSYKSVSKLQKGKTV